MIYRFWNPQGTGADAGAARRCLRWPAPSAHRWPRSHRRTRCTRRPRARARRGITGPASTPVPMAARAGAVKTDRRRSRCCPRRQLQHQRLARRRAGWLQPSGQPVGVRRRGGRQLHRYRSASAISLAPLRSGRCHQARGRRAGNDRRPVGIRRGTMSCSTARAVPPSCATIFSSPTMAPAMPMSGRGLDGGRRR